MKLIDKDKVVTEIERIMNEQQEICKADVAHGKDYPDAKNIEVIYQFQQFIKFLDTLEVKKVEGEELDKLLDWWKEKTTEKVEPKFKVKYAGSEYNVLEVKDIDGVTFYGIEDEPNHIDYVQAANCERVDGYNIKENGSPFPIKPAKFSKENTAWSEEDDKRLINTTISFLNHYADKGYENAVECIDWLKSLQERLSKR